MSIKFKIAGQEYTVDGAAEEDTLLRIESLFKKAMNTSGSVFDPKAQQNFAKAIKDSTKSTDKLNDTFDDLNTSVDDADKSFDDVVTNEKRREKQREDSMKEFKKAVTTNIVSTSQYFAHSIQDATKSFISGLSHATGPEEGVLAFSKVIDTTINVVADGIKAVASAIPIIGGLVAGVVGAGAESAKFINDFLASQLILAIQGYGKVTSAGVLLADGMDQLKATANKAGLGIAEYSDALSRNSETLSRTGLGMTTAAEKFGVAFGELRKGQDQYSRKLFALGYSIQDQADIVAASMTNLSKTTNVQQMSSAQIAHESYEYGKSLRLISDITGKSAKQQMEQQQAAQLNIAVQAKLAQLGPEATKKFNEMMRVLPASAQQAAEQTLLFGHAISGGMAILTSQNRDLAKAVSYSTEVLSDSSVDAATASRNVAGLYANARDSIKTDPTAIAEATAGIANIGGTAGDVSATIATLQTELQSYTNDGIVPAVEAEKHLIENTNNLTGKMAEFADAVAKFKASIEDTATPAVGGYSGVLIKMKKMIEGQLTDAFVTLGLNPDGSRAAPGGKPVNVINGPSVLQQTPQEFADATDRKYPWLAAIDKLLGYGAPPDSAVEGYANGGIASGPTSGFTTTLHGTEAIVPLPDGRSIPVDINTDDLKRDNETRNANTEHRNDLVDEKMLATLQALLNTQEDGNYYSKQNAGMSNAQNNLLKSLVDQMTLNNELLNKIYKTSY